MPSPSAAKGTSAKAHSPGLQKAPSHNTVILRLKTLLLKKELNDAKWKQREKLRMWGILWEKLFFLK